MNIGQRLRELRDGKGFSQGDIEKRTGLFRCYLSRVENGHTTPSLGTLEKWAKALDVKLYELFVEGDEEPKPFKLKEAKPLGPQEEKLFKLIRRMKQPDRQTLLSLARTLSARTPKRQ
jgi:transcriptional regulator with XRE-family HTH domain